MLRRFFYNARTRGPSLARDIIFLVKPDHLGKDKVAMAFCDIFDERRAAPPAYGRRAWSKVVSYLRVFEIFSGIDQSLGVACKTKPLQITKS